MIPDILKQEREAFEKEFPHLGKPKGGEIYGCEEEVRSLLKEYLDNPKEK